MIQKEIISINYKKLSGRFEGFTISVKGDRLMLNKLMISVIGFIGLTLKALQNLF